MKFYDHLCLFPLPSSQPATRSDVIQATTLLDQRLRERQARETGICPVRRELYQQGFDELIRQVTIECAERGLLLLRVRDEINMTLLGVVFLVFFFWKFHLKN